MQEGNFNKAKFAMFAVANLIAHAVAWIVVAPVLDILIYAEPVKKVFAQAPLPLCPTSSRLLWSAAC